MGFQPQSDDAVLGGNNSCPNPGALVLGTGKQFALLFDKFNDKAELCNKYYLRLQLSPLVALIRKCGALPLADIKIKVWTAPELVSIEQNGQIIYSSWTFAGYLKHEGSLFGHTAKYDPASCQVELRSIALKALREAK